MVGFDMNQGTYIHFHIGIGWTGVAFGAIAMALRVPDFFGLMRRIPGKVAGVIRFFHGLFGALFLVCCLFMPITANWIWPRYGTPVEIIYLIASMYVAIVLGLVSIRLYKFLSLVGKANEEASDGLDDDNEEAQEQQINDETFLASLTPQTRCPRRGLTHFFKYAHALIMVYSWVMLLGAGQAFLQNSRTNGFPYPPGPLTDSLVGRCYGRDLQSSEMPGWLTNLTCGLGVMCADPS